MGRRQRRSAIWQQAEESAEERLPRARGGPTVSEVVGDDHADVGVAVGDGCDAHPCRCTSISPARQLMFLEPQPVRSRPLAARGATSMIKMA